MAMPSFECHDLSEDRRYEYRLTSMEEVRRELAESAGVEKP
ncbi:MAG TPA: hypothetical protein VLR69_01890 [Thermoanaerobaculia bacterium]|nr:hypothetical protein [Thermoanaerobaculia bacterium]